MPVRDRYHDHVKHALIKDGWTITHDPLRLQQEVIRQWTPTAPIGT